MDDGRFFFFFSKIIKSVERTDSPSVSTWKKDVDKNRRGKGKDGFATEETMMIHNFIYIYIHTFVHIGTRDHRAFLCFSSNQGFLPSSLYCMYVVYVSSRCRDAVRAKSPSLEWGCHAKPQPQGEVVERKKKSISLPRRLGQLHVRSTTSTSTSSLARDPRCNMGSDRQGGGDTAA
ncbi:hypothetical protein L249_2574 [Ophiocordyceps polyrhachis-furcata BCC 54312]|uniref:Uncharacterized protein n=1 Tax=Ophiocordyceps polyrhachis-furcata BCC 54312 TaxID=1330021 RepID=A0A367LQY7_9HYPO|nr:hypothetical protein L249_2574 [Ophiocordyceps polyrhachis-furcata BCC 54312]